MPYRLGFSLSAWRKDNVKVLLNFLTDFHILSKFDLKWQSGREKRPSLKDLQHRHQHVYAFLRVFTRFYGFLRFFTFLSPCDHTLRSISITHLDHERRTTNRMLPKSMPYGLGFSLSAWRTTNRMLPKSMPYRLGFSLSPWRKDNVKSTSEFLDRLSHSFYIWSQMTVWQRKTTITEGPPTQTSTHLRVFTRFYGFLRFFTFLSPCDFILRSISETHLDQRRTTNRMLPKSTPYGVGFSLSAWKKDNVSTTCEFLDILSRSFYIWSHLAFWTK